MTRPNPAGRAASIWQIVLGGILFLLGTCFGAVLSLLPEDLWTELMHQQEPNLPALGNTSFHTLRIMALVSSGILFSVGLLLLILSFFVRRENRLAIIFSIVLNALFGSLMLTNFLSSLSQIANPTAIVPVILLLGLLAVCAATIVKLVAALRSSGSTQAQSMQQAYYWMMQQQPPAGYGQTGYGYAQAPAPPPPPQAPPPPQYPPPPNPPPAGPSDKV
jgi:hypothetical protein